MIQKRINNKMTFVYAFLLFHSLFIYLDDGSGIGRVLQASFTLILLSLLLPKLTKINLKKEKTLLFFVVMLCFAYLSSSYLNLQSKIVGNISESSSKSLGVLFALRFFCLYILIKYVAIRKNAYLFLKFVYYIIVAYIILTDLTLVFNFKLNPAEDYYLIGSKFNVSYLHIYGLLLYMMLYKDIYKSRKFSFILILYSLLVVCVSLFVECTTSITLLVIILFMFITRRQFFNYWRKANFAMLVLLLSSTFFFIFTNFVLSQDVANFLISIGKDPTFTGRTDLYKMILPLIPLCPFWGFGCGSAHAVVETLTGFPNTQNGLLEIYFENGILGVLATICIIYIVISELKKNKYSAYPLLIGIYAFIIISSIEITLGQTFLGLCFLMRLGNEINFKNV